MFTHNEKHSFLRNQACMYYAIDWYSKLSGMPRDKIEKIAEEVSEISQSHPLHIMPEKQFAVGEFENLSGLQCVSLLVVATDILSGEQISSRKMAFSEWLPIAKQMSIMKGL